MIVSVPANTIDVGKRFHLNSVSNAFAGFIDRASGAGIGFECPCIRKRIMKGHGQRIFSSSRMLLAELLVVFLGVYSAFWVDNYRDQLGREERTREVISVLERDLDDQIKVGGRFQKHMEDGLRAWDEARVRGETPPPFVFRIYGAEKPPSTIWEVARQAQLSELLEPSLVFELGFFYNEISGVGDRYVRYVQFVESEVLPLMKTGSAAFYNESQDRLLPRFEANMDRLREYKEMASGQLTWAECLRDRLASGGEADGYCRTDSGITPF